MNNLIFMSRKVMGVATIYILYVIGILIILCTGVKAIKGGDRQMMAMLMAMNIVTGHYSWERVPRLLKPQVREQLELMGVPELAGEE